MVQLPQSKNIAVSGKTNSNTGKKVEVGDKIKITFSESIDTDFSSSTNGAAVTAYRITYANGSGTFTISYGNSGASQEIAEFIAASKDHSTQDETMTATGAWSQTTTANDTLTLTIGNITTSSSAMRVGTDTFTGVKIKDSVLDIHGNAATDDAVATDSTPITGGF